MSMRLNVDVCVNLSDKCEIEVFYRMGRSWVAIDEPGIWGDIAIYGSQGKLIEMARKIIDAFDPVAPDETDKK